LELGGFFEDFVAWGCEDEAVTLKIKKFLKYKDTNNNGYHLFHTRGNNDKAYHQMYDKNVEILNYYYGLSDEQLLDVCKKTINTIGIF
jgi:hypothetical protein